MANQIYREGRAKTTPSAFIGGAPTGAQTYAGGASVLVQNPLSSTTGVDGKFLLAEAHFFGRTLAEKMLNEPFKPALDTHDEFVVSYVEKRIDDNTLDGLQVAVSDQTIKLDARYLPVPLDGVPLSAPAKAPLLKKLITCWTIHHLNNTHSGVI